ncbi:MAG: hypothetical protein ACREJ3_01745, partial [Polyangiaceae bacterium]
MGDKQAYLASAIPALITRLVQPNCVDANGNAVGGVVQANGACANGSPEFPPVHNMHIGIVSSSLGPRGSQDATTCSPNTTLPLTSSMTGPSIPDHNDDRAELLNRSSMPASINTESPLPGTTPANFLYWYPSVMANSAPPAGGATPITDPAVLGADFGLLVNGVHQFGCGIESQLESWYRFLIQPDPYDSIAVNNGIASWVGVDKTIIQQRHDFLRPDSLVAIIVLTDENDSEIDVRSLGGKGYLFMTQAQQLPRGTSACTTNGPLDPGCMSCSSPAASKSDSECAKGPYTARDDWGEDLNLRHVHMLQKYGVDPQYPIQRYLNGLTLTTVPDRNGAYPQGA